MKALSIRQPWAWMILHAGKDIENRTWPTNVRGRVLVHAAKGMTHEEWDDAWEFSRDIKSMRELPVELLVPLNAVNIGRGGIVGSVEIVDCVQSSASPWFCGPWGFVLRDPQPCQFIPMKGALGFFDVPVQVVT